MELTEISEIEVEIDKLIQSISPFESSNKKRNDVTRFVRNVITSQLNQVVLVGTGSSSLKCYLPESDLDLVLFAKPQQQLVEARKSQNNTQMSSEIFYLKAIFNSLCDEIIEKDENKSSFSDDFSSFTIRNIEFINARTKVTHCMVNNIQVDITVNHISALKSLLFLEEVNKEIGNNHLFKRSLLLVKVSFENIFFFVSFL
jgi:DNA polymerase sigma